MSIRWQRWTLVALVVLLAGWWIVDGTRALLAGTYFTIDGQLGPWADLIAFLGVDPSSTGMKLFFVCAGMAWLGLLGVYLAGRPWAWTGMIVAALVSTFYLPVGTVIGFLQFGLLAADKAQTTRYGT